MSKLIRVRCTSVECKKFNKTDGYFLMTPLDILKSITENNGRLKLPCNHFSNYHVNIPTTIPDSNKIINIGDI
jgi:hypothetical protein